MQTKLIESTNGHFYQIGENEYPSSTTILKRAYPMEIGLKMFMQNNTKEGADKIMDEAGKSGSKVHHAIDLLFQGVEVKNTGFTQEDIDNCGLVDDKLIKYLKKPFTEREDTCLRGFLNWCRKYAPAAEQTEKIVWSDNFKYAGTLDFIGGIRNDKKEPEIAIIDWKTGRGIYKEYDLQLASYWGALKEEREKNNAPLTCRLYLVQLGVNKCGYRMVEVKDPQEKLDQFLTIKKTFDYLYPDYKPYNYEFLTSYKI